MVLGMAQMDHKPALGQYISEVSNESEDPLFLDAQIDDQVMPFPNWNKNGKFVMFKLERQSQKPYEKAFNQPEARVNTAPITEAVRKSVCVTNL